MVKIYECPTCNNLGLKVDLPEGKRIVTTGKPIKELPCVVLCSVCKRKIRYEVV